MTNIKCEGNKEIDLLAINPITVERYHVESKIYTTTSFRTTATYTNAGQCHKNGLDYFHKEKFEHPAVRKKIRELFGDVAYKKVLVVWKTQEKSEGMLETAKQYGIEIMSLKTIMGAFEGLKLPSGSRDDVIRIMELVSLMNEEEDTIRSKIVKKVRKVKDRGDGR